MVSDVLGAAVLVTESGQILIFICFISWKVQNLQIADNWNTSAEKPEKLPSLCCSLG